LDTENLLIEAVDAIIAQAGEDETLTKLLIDFTMEKQMMINLGISREILDTGRLVLNENHRMKSLIFTIKPLPILSKKKEIESCKVLGQCGICSSSFSVN
jgi:hypothetical protein